MAEPRAAGASPASTRGPRLDWAAIEVRGARENNLRGVSLDIPKRRLTVFTGVSGSGKSSLVFQTIAAESRRLINETYAAFVQTFMGTPARPDVDSLEGLTTAIVVDQERLGANIRSTVGTVTDANALLRIVFSRLGQPHIGGPQAFAFNVPSVRGAGSIVVERGSAKKESRTFTLVGGMCPRCEGIGTASAFDLTQIYDADKSLRNGAGPASVGRLGQQGRQPEDREFLRVPSACQPVRRAVPRVIGARPPLLGRGPELGRQAPPARPVRERLPEASVGGAACDGQGRGCRIVGAAHQMTSLAGGAGPVEGRRSPRPVEALGREPAHAAVGLKPGVPG